MEFLLSLNEYSDWGLLALRIAVGVVFLAHGTAKWKMWKPKPEGQEPNPMAPVMKTLSVVEPIAGLAVLLGVYTQVGAAVLGLVMIGAIFMKKFKWGVAFSTEERPGWEFDMTLLAANIMLFLAGGGALALWAI